MPEFLEIIYRFCCYNIAEIGVFFGKSYEAVNVIAFCFVEPLFTILMVLLAVLTLCGLPLKKIGTWFFWVVVSSVIVVLLIGTVRVFMVSPDYKGNIELIVASLSIKESDAGIIKLYDDAIQWLIDTGKSFHLTYKQINLLLYIIVMPALCIASYIIVRLKRNEKVVRHDEAAHDVLPPAIDSE